MSDIKWKQLVEECEWLEKKYKWRVKDVMPSDVVIDKNHDTISDKSFRDMYPDFTMKEFYDSIGWTRMIKDKLPSNYNWCKWNYPTKDFSDSSFRQRFIDCLKIDVEHELEWAYEKFLEDINRLDECFDIKRLCVKYIDIEPDEFETIIAETEKEFEIDYKAHLEACEYIENRKGEALSWEDYERLWEEKK